jgi:hypothetical protein
MKAVLFAISTILAVALPASAQDAKDVNVVNTPNVNVSNTPTVNVGNTASVNVANTSAQPVPSVRVDEPGRIPYQSQLEKSDGSCSGASVCFFNFPSVPSGHRVVIQHISGLVSFSGTNNATVVQLNNGSGAPLSSFFTPQVPSIPFSTFDQTTQGYFDPAVFGGVIEVQVTLFGATFPQAGLVEHITLSGYELDCKVAPCAPIAH